MLNTKTWIKIILIFFSICCISWIALLHFDSGTIAVIEAPGQTYQINLRTAANQDILVNTEYGTNTIEIKDGKIRIKEANCPDKVCVHTGWTNSPALPLVCLPHKLTVTIKKEKNDGIDAVVR